MVGNVVSVYIFAHRVNRKNAVSILLGGLAAFDCAMLLCGTAVFFTLGFLSTSYFLLPMTEPRVAL